MNTAATVVVITLSSLSLIVSSATLTLVLVGTKNVQAEMDELKMKTNKTVQHLKSALENLEI